MMLQFETITINGRRFLCLINPSRYDSFIGMRTIIKAMTSVS